MTGPPRNLDPDAGPRRAKGEGLSGVVILIVLQSGFVAQRMKAGSAIQRDSKGELPGIPDWVLAFKKYRVSIEL